MEVMILVLAIGECVGVTYAGWDYMSGYLCIVWSNYTRRTIC